MTRSRRKKIFTWSLLFILLILSLGYAFRYPLIRWFQYNRLQSLDCYKPMDGEGTSCMDRIWVHRVNSIERLNILKDKFSGFETDVVYDDSIHSYWVYHPPRPEGEQLTLGEFMQHVNPKTKNLWLDTRGVDSTNMQR